MDPVYFFKKYAKIQHPTKGKILFKLYPFQEDALRDFQDHRFNIILKSRQMGISTLSAGWALWNLLFKNDFKILVIATKQDVAKNLVSKVQLMYEFLPDFLKSGIEVVNNNKLSLSFSNGSEIVAVSSSPDSARSHAISLLIVDEAAFMPDAEEIWTSAQMTLATGGNAILLSTPNGAQGLFYKLWQDAETGVASDGLEKFNPIRLLWNLHPDRDQKWRDQQDILLGKRMAAQECIGGNSLITIRNNQNDVIESITIFELESRLKYNGTNWTNYNYDVLTPSGFQNFIGLKRVKKESYIKIGFSDDTGIDCTHNHIFIDFEGNEISTNQLKVDTKIKSINGFKSISNLTEINDTEYFYDLLNVSGGHIYYANDVVNHNCDCSFNTSGHTVIESEILQYYLEKTQEPVEKRGMGGDLWIFKYPIPLHDYVVSVDVSRGDGEDYSAIQVFDVETLEQVAEYKGKIDTQALGRMSISISTDYNDALLIIDNKNIGWSTVQIALDSGYKNLYYSYKNDPFLDENIHLRKNYDLKNKEDMVPGLTIDTRIRPVLISKLEAYFLDKTPIIYSKRTLNELYTFMWINGKPQAQKGYSDDLVMALCMFLYIRDTSLRLRQMGIELVKKATQSFHRSVYKQTPITTTNWEMNVGRGGKENLKWLL